MTNNLVDVAITESDNRIIIGEGPCAARARAAAIRREAIVAEMADFRDTGTPIEKLLARVRRLELVIANQCNLDPTTLKPIEDVGVPK